MPWNPHKILILNGSSPKTSLKGTGKEYQMEHADCVFVMSNRFATQGKAAVNKLRKQGINAGLLKIALFRPFPADAIAQSPTGHSKVGVIDQNLSPGLGGITFPEVARALYTTAGTTRPDPAERGCVLGERP